MDIFEALTITVVVMGSLYLSMLGIEFIIKVIWKFIKQ